MNSMIYICYIIQYVRNNVVICVLAIGNNKLTVRDNDDISLEVAEAGHMWEGSGRSCRWA
jgi:hypothetical protein